MYSAQSASATNIVSTLEAVKHKQKPKTIEEHVRQSPCNFGYVSSTLGLRFGDKDLELQNQLDFERDRKCFEFVESNLNSGLSFRDLVRKIGGTEKILSAPVTLEDVFCALDEFISGASSIYLDKFLPNVFLVDGYTLEKRGEVFIRKDLRQIHPVFVSAYKNNGKGDLLWSVFSHSPHDKEAWMGVKRIWLPKNLDTTT